MNSAALNLPQKENFLYFPPIMRSLYSIHDKKDLCFHCNGYYAPSFGQPLCLICHTFLHPDYEIFPHPPNVQFLEKMDDGDSGNEEPREFVEFVAQRQQTSSSASSAGSPAECEPTAGPSNNFEDANRMPIPSMWQMGMVGYHRYIPGILSLLTVSRPPEDRDVDPEVLLNLPSEVWFVIFSFLDDVTLWIISKICVRFQQLVNSYVSDSKWEKYTKQRWPLFKSLYNVKNWKNIYTNLTESAPCIRCLRQMKFQTAHISQNSWCRIRLKNELRFFQTDPPEGIAAEPLDKMALYWQAVIVGPAGSPYAGGTFFLYVQIPPNYPLCPPLVKFISRIFHPNVSRHGDIGIDSIQHNWSLALTIPKVLISIQSLLTDPYTKVCMEPEIGHLYENDREEFKKIAKSWTWKYAMHDSLDFYSDDISSQKCPKKVKSS